MQLVSESHAVYFGNFMPLFAESACRWDKICKLFNMNLAVSIMDINVVISDTTQNNKTDLHLIALIYEESIDLIIYENTDNITALCKLIRIRRKPGLQEPDLKLPITVGCFKKLAVVFFCVEKAIFKAFIYNLTYYSNIKLSRIMFHYSVFS